MIIIYNMFKNVLHIQHQDKKSEWKAREITHRVTAERSPTKLCVQCFFNAERPSYKTQFIRWLVYTANEALIVG